MELTFGTLIILLFFIPGLLIKRTYFSSPISPRYTKSSLLNDISWLLVSSLFIHMAGIFYVDKFDVAEFDQFTKLLKAVNESSKEKPDYTLIDVDVIFLLRYNLILWASSAFLGYALNRIVRKTHIDKRINFLEFNNEWYYYLSGEILDFPDVEGSSKDVGLVFVDALVNTGNENVIYSGICTKYHLNEQGGLSSICISSANRIGFVAGKVDEISAANIIPGNVLIIPASKIVNINIRYFKVRRKEEVKENKAQEAVGILESVVLAITFIILLILLISLISKPDKPEKEKKLEWIDLVAGLGGLAVGIILYFSTNWGALTDVCAGIGMTILIVIFGYRFLRKDPPIKKIEKD